MMKARSGVNAPTFKSKRWMPALLCSLTVALALPGVVSSGDVQATAAKPAVRWLALGDSYSSGEGIPGTTTAGNQQGTDDCARATGENSTAKAYSIVAGERLAGDDRYTFEAPFLVACTGAITDGAWTQLDEMRNRVEPDSLEKWNIVSYSFGGNNIGFADILKDCTDLNNWGALNVLSPGCSTTEQQLRDSIDVLVGNRDPGDGVLYNGQPDRRLPDVFDAAAGYVVPGGHVIVVGYPHFVEESGRWKKWRKLLNSCENISPGDAGMLRSAAGYLNEQIGAAVIRADERWAPKGIRFHFVDISKQVYETSENDNDRHGLCSQSPWLNGISLGIPTAGDVRPQRSFHPKQQGHTATGEYIASLVTDYDFTPPATGPAECSNERIGADLAIQVTIIEGLCLKGFAYVDTCSGDECGDSQRIVRLVAGAWVDYTLFPNPTLCRSAVIADGLPAVIVDRINWFCEGNKQPADDYSPYRLVSLDPTSRTITIEPWVLLDASYQLARAGSPTTIAISDDFRVVRVIEPDVQNLDAFAAFTNALAVDDSEFVFVTFAGEAVATISPYYDGDGEGVEFVYCEQFDPVETANGELGDCLPD